MSSVTTTARLAAAPRTDDLYTAWLDAIRALGRPVEGALPSFARTTAYADLRYNTTLAAYAQLRHNHVLVAGQPYGESGCKIPDGYVEPAPSVFDALARYADLGARQIGTLTPASAVRDYFVRLGTIARVLAAISRIELAGQPLPDEAQRFLGMVSEIGPHGSDGRPTYTGWYFDLFIDREDAIAQADLIADYVTMPRGVGYLGVASPVLAIFAVDTGGGPRAMIGPVARAYEHWGHGRRLDDEAARQLPPAARRSPWTASYLAAAPPRPRFRVQLREDRNDRKYIVISAARPLGVLTIEELDHNRVPVQRITRRITAGTTWIRFKEKDSNSFRPLLHFQLGSWHGWGEILCPIEGGCRLEDPS
jgi:hypothetical protein